MMCGVFGWVSKNDAGPNVKILKAIATVTERRGPHAWGLAWIDRRGTLKMYKQSGRISDHLGLLESLAGDAQMLIGHCRYATHGSYLNNLNNHPHPADGGWIVHNGIVRNYLAIADREDLHPVTDCDSEVLGQLIENADGTYLDRCVEAVLQTEKAPLVLLGLWARPQRLCIVRQGNPLHISETKRGTYIASLADGMPGSVSEIKDESALDFGPDDTQTQAF
jgi:glucosamine 6-phosphate synthetase-like amidotransferase/phosphosugar isomerase protein